MTANFITDPAWHAGVPLWERELPPREFRGSRDQRAAAGRRLKRWRATQSLVDDVAMGRRLVSDGLDEDSLLRLLALPTHLVRPRPGGSAWMSDLRTAYQVSATAQAESGWTPAGDHPMGGFLGVVAPLVHQAVNQLRSQAGGLTVGGAPFEVSTAVECALKDIEPRLLTMVGRCMVLELNVRRLRGELHGVDAKERFDDFCRQLSQPTEALYFLRRYPVLARRLVIVLDHWVSATVELLRRVRDDAAHLGNAFSPDVPLGSLISFMSGQGDYHRGGRSVAILTFSTGVKVVYKPRSLAAELHYQDLLRWIAARCPDLEHWTPRIVERGTHGWVEFVANAACEHPQQLQRFYRRQGSLLAILYLLEGADLHHENLLAVGEHPVLIDLEALFHRPAAARALPAGDRAEASVLETGLLPAFVGSVDSGVDMSGMGATAGQQLPGLIPHWQHAGTDHAHVVRRRIALTESRHRPVHAGTFGDPREYLTTIAAGFSYTYRWLAANRMELLAADGPIAAFAEDPVRVILRPTRTYEHLLDESHHPDLVTDAVAMEGYTNRLWDKIDEIPYLADVVIDERDALDNGDVPIFTTRPGATDLQTSSGRTVQDFFNESGLTRARHRIVGLGEADLAEQLWLLRTSLAPRVRLTFEAIAPDRMLDSATLIGAARIVGDRIVALASGEPSPIWHGMRAQADGIWRPGPLGNTLYNGSGGIALFLALLGRLSQDDSYTRIARTAVNDALVLSPIALTPLVGGFLGVGGTVYVLATLARLWSDEHLLEAAEASARRIVELISNDDEFDVMGGAAGAVLGLLCLARLQPDGPAISAAVRCGEHLLQRSCVLPDGRGWRSAGAKHAPLGGLSHGAGGIAMALLQLAAATGECSFATCAESALAYERTTFRSDVGNWLDLRDGLPTPHFGSRLRTMTAWCHGATGVGLSRLVMLRHADNDVLRHELDIAVQTTLREGFGSSHSLCHGDMGSLELLLQHHLAYPDAVSQQTLSAYAARVFADIGRTGWHCGNPLRVESPDLMTGIAGIGYQLLRLADPEQVPAVLTLEDLNQ